MPAMCDEHLKLIDYVYGECGPDEAQRVEAHLAGCGTCRGELSGLRAVRQDLLAWDVPEHGSVWTPFAPARPRPWWREVPAWALAAAASGAFLLGVGGGLAARALLPGEVATVEAAAPADTPRPITPMPIATESGAAAVPVQATVSPDVLREMEQRIGDSVRRDLDQRVQLVAAHAVSASEARQADTFNATFRSLWNDLSNQNRADDKNYQMLLWRVSELEGNVQALKAQLTGR